MKGAVNRVLEPLRRLGSTVLHEGVTPGRAAAAIFVGVFIGHVPIYGLQALSALGLAFVFGLNKPLTLAATFVNNPLLQPIMVVASVEIGHFLFTGRFRGFAKLDMTPAGIKAGLAAWVVGSLVLGVLVGGCAALAAFAVVRKLQRPGAARAVRDRYVRGLFAACQPFERRFVKWKLRLDRIFDYLAAEDLGAGPVVDLGCGYGIASGFVSYGQPERALIGCDLDAGRIAAARIAFADRNASLSVADMRQFPLPPAGLILILDVLQYLSATEQLALLASCCHALEPGGKLIFRVHDRERGVYSALAMALDTILFRIGGVRRLPAILPSATYRAALEREGLRIRVHRFRNRLPLAHYLFIAERAAPGGAGR